ncbi:MAG: efflux RND transporter periplasmic adaptor subunit [Thermoguttaceae bacterium]
MPRIITSRRVFWLLTTIAFIGASWVGCLKLRAVWRKSAAERFRTGIIRRGDLKFEVRCSGTIQPVLSVQVGSYVSGPIQKVCVDFNDRVKKGQILAELDPKVYKAQCRQAKASLAHAIADLKQCQAKLYQTDRDFKRAKELYKISDIPGVDHPIKGIADSEYDLAKANFEMSEANVEIAKATVEQNKAALDMVETNLGYTTIRSPVDGIVIDRKVDAGQTLASQFQTPVMFVVAPDLEKKVYIMASVDEADIGLVREAETNGQPVIFTVDAYQDEKFEGKIRQVRLGPKEGQANMPVTVVTYTVVVEAPNKELKLMPGMTANLFFQIEKHENVLKISNAALRFHPRPEYVHPKHRALLEGLAKKKEPQKEDSEEKAASLQPDDEQEAFGKDTSSDADEGNEKTVGGAKKYVWLLDGDLLSPLEIEVGISDGKYTELLHGDLKGDQKMVTGMKTAAEIAAEKASH